MKNGLRFLRDKFDFVWQVKMLKSKKNERKSAKSLIVQWTWKSLLKIDKIQKTTKIN